MMLHTSTLARSAHMLRKALFSSQPSIKNEILAKALSYQSSLGWTDEAIVQSVRDLNLNPVSHTIVGRGAVETVEYLLSLKHKHVMDQVREFSSDLAPFPDPSKEDILERQRKILKHALFANLNFMEPYRANWPPALALLLAPAQVPHTLELVHRSVNDLCLAAEIQGTRYDWYSERAAVASLVSLTEFYMVQDQSTNLEDTRAFITRELELYDTLRIQEGGVRVAMELLSTFVGNWSRSTSRPT